MSEREAPRLRPAYVAVPLFAMLGLALIPPSPASAQVGSVIVTVTSPTSGSTVTGTITVSAGVSVVGSLTVAGVQFMVDGANLGAEDPTPPYAVPWDTKTANDGSHTLTAVARDALGVSWTSEPVTVEAANATVTRFENTDLSITYTDGTAAAGRPPAWWHGSRSRGWSGKIASFNRSEGARAAFSFTGTTVRWIGFRAPWAGIARVFLDDVFVSELDLYAPSEEERAVVFSRTGLPNGSHTLTVEATGRKNAASPDYAVVVDAFDVAPASPPPTAGTRVEETALTLTGGWTPAGTTGVWSDGTPEGGAAVASATPGAQATFSFIGTEVRWIGFRGPGTGIARVFLDGAFQAEVDTFAPTEMQAVVFAATSLAAATHTLTIDVTGRMNPAATDSVIVVDALDVRARIEDPDPSLAYTATFQPGNTDKAWSGASANTGTGSAAFSRTAGANATVTFTGTSASWIGLRAPWTGIARVLLDGAFVAEVDTFAPREEIQAVLFSAAGLVDAPHTLTVEVTGQRSASSIDSFIVVDAFDLTLSSSAPPIRRFQETDPSTTYSGGGWTQGTNFHFWSGEAAAYSGTAGARATFTFTGTAVRWVGQRGFNTGIARVWLDGVQVAEIDTFAPVQEEFQAALFSATGLADTSHTLTIEATGQKNASAFETWVIVDAFDIY